jgi:hypothetical protein
VETLVLVVGVLLLLTTVVDALTTTVAPDSGGGVVSSRVAHGTWWVVQKLARRPGGVLHRSTGPVVTALTVATWLLGLWAGWSLVFLSSPEAVVDDATGAPSDGWSRVYFAGFTVFTLGIGDHVPASSPWQLATVLGVISGLVFTTLAITFVLPVVTAVTERRQQSCRIASLGNGAQDIVVNGWDGRGFAALEGLLPGLADQVLLTAERNLAYPILAYYLASTPTEDHRVQLVALDEAATLLRHAVDHDQVEMQPLTGQLVRHAVRQQLDRAALPMLDVGDTEPFTLDLTPLREAGIPTVDDATFDDAVESEAEHRGRLAALVSATRWEDAVAVRSRDA